MKIVVVDHVYLEKEHVKRLRSIGDLEVFNDPPKTPDELKERIKAADIVIVGWSDLTKDVIDSVKKLKMISIWATTCHYADLSAAKEKGIVVTHVPGYATEAVAEHTFALLLAGIRKLPLADKRVRKGDFDWRPFGGVELHGKTLGIIGTGSIGCRVAEIAKVFKMQILAYDKYPNVKKAEEIGMRYVDLYTLLKESDFITLHVALTSETERLIGKKEIKAMKKGAVVINTSQGRVINEKALIDALKSGKISFAGLDVFEEEPPSKDNPLFKLENTILSPHVGFHTVEAAKRCTDICIDNVVKFLEGRPQNVC
ncbi:MAG: 2-hydroxyacid dehydrogenase [Candidatus Bathyarchaeota archaeon]|nr:2-hydroxyacid dehydrogenase [Candidatus Bathyarchaeota archaeon]MDH5745383.1 2-hydroxyacid dehydrogenase [Candidatus Bathyarchaeota archaeon]